MSSETSPFPEYDDAVKRAEGLLLDWLEPTRPTPRLVDMSDNDATAHDLLCRATAAQIKKGNALEPSVTEWLVQYLNGQRPKPAAKRGRKAESYAQRCVHLAVKHIAHFYDLPISKNNQITPQKNERQRVCALDIVTEAMRRLSRTPNTYDAVKKAYFIYDKQKPIRPFVWRDAPSD